MHTGTGQVGTQKRGYFYTRMGVVLFLFAPWKFCASRVRSCQRNLLNKIYYFIEVEQLNFNLQQWLGFSQWKCDDVSPPGSWPIFLYYSSRLRRAGNKKWAKEQGYDWKAHGVLPRVGFLWCVLDPETPGDRWCEERKGADADAKVYFCLDKAKPWSYMDIQNRSTL